MAVPNLFRLDFLIVAAIFWHGLDLPNLLVGLQNSDVVFHVPKIEFASKSGNQFSSDRLLLEPRRLFELLFALCARKWGQAQVNSLDVSIEPVHFRESFAVKITDEWPDPGMNDQMMTSQIGKVPVA